MRTARFSVGLLLAVALFAGCGGQGRAAYRKYNLGAAEPSVVAAIESAGGLAAWRKVGQIRASALMTIYSDGNRPYVNRQKHEIDIDGRSLTIQASAVKSWRASYSAGWGGRFSLRNGAALGSLGSDDLRKTMALLLHRLVGPLNLLGGKEKVGPVSNVVVDGKGLVRVGVTGDTTLATAYYFDPNGGGLKIVTGGSEQPGGQGTVTIYEYQILPNGLVFPKRIRLVRTGRHVLVGSTPIMEVEYSDVTVH